jgi:hypothetical protein
MWILKLLLLPFIGGIDYCNTMRKIKKLDNDPTSTIKSDDWYRKNGK